MKLPAGLLGDLRVHRAAQDRLRLAQGANYTDLGLAFCQPNGKPLDPHNILNRDFHRTLRRAGLRRIRFHDLRHTSPPY